jgi:hypothetical protein
MERNEDMNARKPTVTAVSRIKAFQDARKAFLKFDQMKPSAQVTSLSQYVKVFVEEPEHDAPACVIFGVKREEQGLLSFTDLRRKISEYMGYQSTSLFMGITGDSALYSKAGTAAAQAALNKELAKNDNIVLYGYTGSSKNRIDTAQCDVNQLVGNWVDAEAHHERSNRVIANIVDEHTVKALGDWKGTFSAKVRYFFMVYTDTPHPSAKFGDDVVISAGLTNGAAYVLDGGIQSFREMVSALCRHVPVYGWGNLRDLSNSDNDRYFDPTTKLPYLSAAEFLQYMKDSINDYHGEITEASLLAMANEYHHIHALYNRSSSVSDTKDALWNQAWSEFVRKGWQCLDAFSYQLLTTERANENSAKALVARYVQATRVRHDDREENLISRVEFK